MTDSAETCDLAYCPTHHPRREPDARQESPLLAGVALTSDNLEHPTLDELRALLTREAEERAELATDHESGRTLGPMTTTRRDPTEALTATEAARALGVAPRTVKRIRPTELPYFRVGTRGDRRYRRAHVEAYIRDRTLGL